MGDWISVVEAAYSLDGDLTAWTRRVLDACAPLLDTGSGLAACHFKRDDDGFAVEHIATRPDGAGAIAVQKLVELGSSRIASDLVLRRGPEFASLCEQMGEHADAAEDAFRRATRGRFADGRGGIAHSADGRALAIGSGLLERTPTSPELRERWAQVASHLGAGLRLLHALAPEDDGADDAVLDAGGRVLDARGKARCESSREILRAAVRRIGAARTRCGRSDSARALASWQGLVAGRWSLVDRFEADGRRYVVARRNDPRVTDPRGLRRLEAQVAELLALGHSEKQIAYSLGLSAPTVSRLLRGALRKLGLGSRAELAALFASFSNGLERRSLCVGGERLAVGVTDAAPESTRSRLSRAEREIANLVCRGRTDAEIARARGASRRTVGNQLHTVYRKLGIHSRTELAARLSA